MIYIDKNTTNVIVLTLNESSTFVDPNYLFKFQFEDDRTVEPIWFTTPNLSDHVERYDEFEITDATDSPVGSTTGGDNIPLNLKSGQYTYTVYATDISPIDINDIDLDYFEEVETGYMRVTGTDNSIDSRYL